MLLLAERVATRDARRSTSGRARRRVIGLAQALRARAGRLALGRDDHRPASSSASTATAAARYSFLLSVPAVVLSGLFELRHVGGERRGAASAPTAVATLVAFVVGYASIAFLLRYLATHTHRHLRRPTASRSACSCSR